MVASLPVESANSHVAHVVIYEASVSGALVVRLHNVGGDELLLDIHIFPQK